MTRPPPGRRVVARRSSTRELRRALAATRGQYRDGSAPTLGQLLSSLGSEAAALSAALLALPFLSPVSLGPITTAVSVVIAILGWQLLRSSTSTPLGARFLQVQVPYAVHRAMTAVLRRVHRLMHRASRVRLTHLVDGRRGRRICAAGIIAGSVLLAVPIPLLPLTNTFPALGILLFALGWLERDGLLTVLGSVSLLLAVAIFSALGALVLTVGADVIRGGLDWRALFSTIPGS